MENLINDSLRNGLFCHTPLPGLLLVGLLLPRVSVHLKELGDLRSGDSTAEGLPR